MLRVLLSLLFTLCTVFSLQAETAIPQLHQRVTDLTQTLSSNQVDGLESRLALLEQQSHIQMAILLIPTTNNQSIEQYSVNVFEQWKLGQKNIDNGILMVIAKNDHNIRIEVGYGLEGTLTDVQTARIIREIIPKLQQEQYYLAISISLDHIINIVDNIDTKTDTNIDSEPDYIGKILHTLIFSLMVVPILGALSPFDWAHKKTLSRYLICCSCVALIGAAKTAFVDHEELPNILKIAFLCFGISSIVFAPGLLNRKNRRTSNKSNPDDHSQGGGGFGDGGRGGGGFGGGGGGRSGGGGASGHW